jgi:hypothetical protein
MIRAVARVTRNVIEIEVGTETWVAKPVPSLSAPIVRQISSLFSTVYEVFRPSDPKRPRATVSYGAKKDEILIQVGEQRVRTTSSVFGPMTFELDKVPFEVHEKLTGRFGIFRAGELVGTGQLGFRSCEIKESPPEYETLFADLALGYLIRTLFWEMFR